MKRINLKSLILLKIIFFPYHLFALDTLSYSGRLVQTNGSPISGPVTIRAELAYTNALTTILCTEDIPNVTLTKGVFHVKLNLDCSASGLTLTQVLSQVPNGESIAIQITDVTNSKSYNFQALHAIPFASVASQLLQMGATNDQVLKWNNTSKKWEPGTPGGGGTVTSVSGTLPISVANGASSPVISISQASSTTNGYLSSSDWNTFNGKQNALPGGGNSTHYLRGDSTWRSLNTDAVAEGTNLYFTNSRVLSVPITAPTLTNSTIATNDTVQVALGKLQAQFNNILSLVLTGLSTATNATISASDTMIEAFGKLQKQITDLSSNVTTLSSSNANKLNKNTADSITSVITVSGAGDILVPSTPAGMTSVVNKTYVDDRVANGLNQWSEGSGNVYRSSGNVGIGKTNPGSSLDVRGSLRLSGSTSGYVGFTPAAVAGSTTYTLPSSDGSNGYVLTTNGAGVLSWGAASGAGTYLPLTGGTVTGNITINAASAISDAMTFQVNGVTHSRIDGYGVIRSSALVTGAMYADDAIYAQGGVIATKSSLNLELKANDGSGVTGLILEAATNDVGIGTTNPGYRLDVQGGDINASGSVRAAGVALTSDIRYKKNIKTLENSLDKILKIRGVSYDWRTGEFPKKGFNDLHQVGVIAQEVEHQFPEIVETNKEGYKSVNYPALVAPLIESVKELYKRQIASKENLEEIRLLKKEISQIKADNIKIRSENSEMKSRLEKIERLLKSK